MIREMLKNTAESMVYDFAAEDYVKLEQLTLKGRFELISKEAGGAVYRNGGTYYLVKPVVNDSISCDIEMCRVYKLLPDLEPWIERSETVMSAYKPTNSDWYPCIISGHGMMASISLHKVDPELVGEKTRWIINGSGDDDFEIECHYDNENQALCDYMALLGKDKVNINDFDDLSGYIGYECI